MNDVEKVEDMVMYGKEVGDCQEKTGIIMALAQAPIRGVSPAKHR